MTMATILKAPSVTLNDGRPMPQLGFGTWQISDREADRIVAEAIGIGYRLIDSASIYENEAGVGRAIAAAGVPRKELFITTKVWNDRHGYDATLKAFDESLRKLRLDAVDLYLIHWPVAAQDRYVDTWRALIELRRQGRARSIGVSNFHPEHLRRVIAETGVTPAVNQIELHPALQQRELQEFHRAHRIVTECWSPFAQGELISNRQVAAIAKKCRRTPAQVILRWHLDHGFVAIPKSSSRERAKENFESLSFRLDPADLSALDALDQNRRMGPHPDTFS